MVIAPVGSGDIGNGVEGASNGVVLGCEVRAERCRVLLDERKLEGDATDTTDGRHRSSLKDGVCSDVPASPEIGRRCWDASGAMPG